MQPQNKTKILYLITKAIWGGAQSYIYDLATNLPKEKYEVVVLAGEGEELFSKLENANIRYIKIASLQRDINIFKEIHSFIEINKIINNEKPDVVHLNSSKAGFLGGLASRINGVPKIIFTAHGWSFNEKRSLLSIYIFTLLHWLTILLAHKTIAVSKKTKIDVRNMPFIENKIEIIYNGIKSFNLKNKQSAKEFLHLNYIDTNIPLIGTISELHPNKGLDIIISSLVELKNEMNFKFIIIGEGQEDKNLKEIIQKHNLKEQVLFLGKIENAKENLKAFDIFTLTSRTEALPYTIIEAGMAGLPVLATRVGGIPEIIDNEKSGLIVRPDKTEIFFALKKLLEHPQKAKDLGLNLQTKVVKEFSFQSMFEKTLKLYSANL